MSSVDEQRAMVLVVASGFTAIFGLFFAVVYALSDNLIMCAAVLVGTLSALTPFVVLRMGGRIATAGHALALHAYLSLCAQIWLSGGTAFAGLVWLFYPPVAAMLFAGARSGVIWAVICTSTCLGIHIVDTHLYPSPFAERELSTFLTLASAIALISINSLLFFLHARLQGWLVDSLDKAQRQALRATQQGYRTLLDEMPEALLVTRDERPIYVNPAFTEMLGYTLDELLEEAPPDLVPEREMQRRRELEAAIMEGDVAHSMREGVRIRKQGTRLDVETRTFRAPFDGKPAVFISFRDITERKRLQAKMMQLDRMTAVGTLAAGVAHEINNPLAFLSANASLLSSELSNGTFDDWSPPSQSLLDHEELEEVLVDMLEGAERIRRIVSSLRAFSGSEESPELDGAVDISKLLDSCQKMAGNEIKHRARLIMNLDDVPAVRGDNAQLGQVFLNLLVNAAHAIPPGHSDTNEIRVEVTFDDPMVCVRVSDTGSGIPADVQSRIFDPFFTTKGDRDGMGLGLYISQDIVREHGGELTMTSKENQGTTFEVLLPSTLQAPSTIHRPLNAGPSTAERCRVMLIDDESKLLRILQRALANNEVHSFQSGRAAVDHLRQDPRFDVILCDLLMPQMSGMQFYEHLREEFPMLVDRVIFMSGGTFTEEADRFAATCNRPMLAKPFGIDELRNLIAEQIETARPVRESAPSP